MKSSWTAWSRRTADPQRKIGAAWQTPCRSAPSPAGNPSAPHLGLFFFQNLCYTNRCETASLPYFLERNPERAVCLLEHFLIVAGQVVTLFLMMAVGFALAKLGWMSEETTSQMSHLLIYVVAPCIIIQKLQIDANWEVVSRLGLAALAMALYYIIFLSAVQLLYRKQPVSSRVVCRFGSVYGNNSFMGLPLLSGVLGEEALIYGVISMLVFAVFQWTHGVLLMGGHLSLKKAVINPGILAILAGLLLFATGARLPATLNNAVGYLADLNTPLAMVVIGAQMARSDILAAFRQPELYASAALKLVLAPAVMCVVLLPLHMDPLAYCACVVLSACPTAGVTGIFAQLFHRDTATAARMVTLSTLLSVVTLPVLAVLSQRLGGLL